MQVCGPIDVLLLIDYLFQLRAKTAPLAKKTGILRIFFNFGRRTTVYFWGTAGYNRVL
jgi:hypothetical protein